MSAFFDTNILVYAQQRGDKAEKARALLATGGVLSVQVLNEFASVGRRKLGKTWQEIDDVIADVLLLVGPPVPVTLVVHEAARVLARDHTLSFYDALIVAAAREAGCGTLFTEDMQHGRAISGLTIVNPFVS